MLSFERDEPAALRLIQADDQQIDALVKSAIRVRLTSLASRASAWMERGGHRQPSSRLTKQASRALNQHSAHLVPCRVLRLAVYYPTNVRKRELKVVGD